MRILLIVLMAAAVSGPVPSAQIDPPVQQRFEAGLYDQALQLVADRRQADAATAGDLFVAVQILLKQGRPEEARQELARLAKQPDGIWALVAHSATALLDDDRDRALEAAQQAATEHPDSFFAFYQFGLVQAEREEWAGAAAAFDRAAELDPAFAYAHYYAGFSYSRIRRVDLTAVHFSAFLKLAPKAPERPAVESIMRTLRGR